MMKKLFLFSGILIGFQIDAQSLIGGTDHSLFLCSDSIVRSWGNDAYGELGNGTNTNTNVSGPVVSLTGVRSIASKGNFSLAIKNDSTAWAWGKNMQGQLGNGTTSTPGSNIPVLVTLTGVKAIGGGQNHSLAVKGNGTVWSWGSNGTGQLGDGTNTSSSVPVQVNGLAGFKSVSGGAMFSLALKTDSTVWSWGGTGAGPVLGNGAAVGSNVPVQVHGPGNIGFLTGIIAITTGYGHSLVIKGDQTVWAWGNNANGELGDGTTTNQNVPVQITALSGIIAIDGGENHSAALKSDGTVWTWGKNSNGQLGNGTSTASHVPIQVSSLSGIVEIATGSNHTLALKNDGTVYAWGRGPNGQLGNGASVNSLSPVTVNGPCFTTSIDEIKKQLSVFVFPNPSEGKFQISILNFQSEILHLKVTDILGNEVHSERIANAGTDVTLDLSHLQNGVYFLTGANSKTQKIFIEK